MEGGVIEGHLVLAIGWAESDMDKSVRLMRVLTMDGEPHPTNRVVFVTRDQDIFDQAKAALEKWVISGRKSGEDLDLSTFCDEEHEIDLAKKHAVEGDCSAGPGGIASDGLRKKLADLFEAAAKAQQNKA
jgi:hypothetical protein